MKRTALGLATAAIAGLALPAVFTTPVSATDLGPDTCRQGYVWREAGPSDRVCVTPAVRAQAAQDNAVKASRWVKGHHGPQTCVPGYVWREAGPADRVCVTPAVRAQAAQDNAVKASRWVDGAYGPHTCVPGYVWREAFAGDDVCVTGAVRTQAAQDNAVKASRWITGTYGPYTCVSGYVWREAFAGDRVCVTPAVRDQARLDNRKADERKVLARLWITKSRHHGRHGGQLVFNGDHFNFGRVKLVVRRTDTGRVVMTEVVRATPRSGSAGGTFSFRSPYPAACFSGSSRRNNATVQAYDTISGRRSDAVPFRIGCGR